MSRRKPPPVTLPKVGGEGRLELQAVQISDPFRPSQKVIVVKNVRANPLDYLYHQGHIDDAQYAAGNRFRQHYERGEIGASGAIDYSRTKVDGGKLQDPLTEAVYAARRALLKAREATGAGGYGLLVAVVGEGTPVAQIARQRPSLCHGLVGKRAEGYVSGRLREALDDLVGAWGLIAVGNARRTVKAARNLAITGPADEWEVGGQFGDTLVQIARRPIPTPPKPKPRKLKKPAQEGVDG